MRRIVRTVTLAIAVTAAAASCTQAGGEAAPESAPTAPVGAPPQGAPTWYRDVEPITQVHCLGCHTLEGSGAFLMSRTAATSIADFLAENVAQGKMPPWPVGPLSPPVVGARGISEKDVATIVAWAAAGAPPGDPADHVERQPAARPLPNRGFDLVLEPEDARAYAEPPSRFATDETRCFVMKPSAPIDDARITAARFLAGVGRGVHDMGAVVVDAIAADALRARSGGDARAGFECSGGLGDYRGVLLGAHDTGSGPPAATILPAGTAVVVPKGGAIVMRVHYGVKHLAGALDRSTMQLWLARGDEAPSLRPLERISVEAPVEIPCPTGVSSDPANPCSREAAFAQLANVLPEGARERADAKLVACGTSLAALSSTLAFSSGGAERFLVPTSCTEAAPFDGTIRLVRPQLLTFGASVRVEAEQPNGTWAIVLDIPRWRWAWAGSYALETGVPIHTGRGIRVSCTFDNGTANQWSAQFGEPGHNAPARPPWLAPRYIVGAPHRAAERCAVDLAVDRR